jgi:hypothetical protein
MYSALCEELARNVNEQGYPGNSHEICLYVTVARKTMERDGLAPTLIMTTGLQRPQVPQAA